MTLARDQQKAFVVEGMTASRLESSDVRTFGQLTASETVAPLRIVGEQVLMGPLQFTLQQCTPATVPGAIAGSCAGHGTIQPASNAKGDLGLSLLRLGDTGTCQGTCLVQQGSSVISWPNVVCRLRIADSGQKAAPPSKSAAKAGSPTRSKKNQPLMLKIAFRAFIHRDLTLYGTESGNDRCWSFEPWPFGQQVTVDDFGGGIETEIQFRGDCRGFGEKGTSRVEHEIEVVADSIGAFAASNVTVRSQIGESHQRVRRREIGRNMSDWTPWRVRNGRAANRGQYVIRGGNEIEIVGQAAYPFRPSPAIDYRVAFTFLRLDGKQVSIKYEGSHDLFPDYELIVNDTLVWKYVTTDLGPSPFNLIPWRNFSGSVTMRFGSPGKVEVEPK